ncbi:putative domain HDIG [Sedimentisphaera cyanobacteriorum]|uniref:Putative domain HDIG n=1 Tax=Sedimentisphaera cyanobacteriorum TaxID=1940790 RepID=A0A1Q2HN98_9BACT|nr:HD domain-containing protein [Sedimentisphaera cyanobacteriorum]AQQ08928.1 putative domain HDIG [Sedimentisphaera cyanobacteriorum]
MEIKSLNDIKNWAENYIKSFYCDDNFINEKTRLKHIHTYKVAEIIRGLAEKLGLDNQQILLAEAIGLLHDIGRFRQIQLYRTFQDRDSESHSLLGVKVIKELGVLDGIEQEKREIILESVKHHSDMDVRLSPGLPALTDIYVRLIRDADKLDICRVIKETHKKLINSNYSENFLVTLGISRSEVTDDYTEDVLQDVIQRRQADYNKVQTLTDRKLLQLCWVYDLNFRQTLELMVDEGYLQFFFDILPHTPGTMQAKESVAEYIESKVSGLSSRLSLNSGETGSIINAD